MDAMKNLHYKIIFLFLLCLPLKVQAISDKNTQTTETAITTEQMAERHLHQIDAALRAEIQFLQSITDEDSVVGREGELFEIYQAQEQHKQALFDLASKNPQSEILKTAFKKLMEMRVVTDDALMKELLRLKENTKIASLRTEAQEKSRANKTPKITLEKVLVAGKLAESDAQLLKYPEKMLDQIHEEFKKWNDLDSQQRKYIAVKISHILKANDKNARAFVELAQWHLSDGYIKDRFYEPEPYQKAKFCNEQAMKLEPTRVSAWSQKITMAKTFLDATTIRDVLNTYASDREDTFPEKASALLWLYENDGDKEAYANLIRQLADKVQQGVARNEPDVKYYGFVMESIQEYFLQHDDLKSADQFFAWHRAWRNDHAWVLGNYADIRLLKTGDYETSIEILETALAKMNYGIGRKNLARAYYVASVMEKRNLNLINAARYKLKLWQSGYKKAEFIPEIGRLKHAPTVAAILDDFGNAGLSLAEDRAGRTALHFAALEKNLETVRVLVGLGADIQAFDDTGSNAIFYAAKNDDVEMLKFFVANGADLNKKSPQFDASALHVAALHGSIAAADLLLGQGADINAVSTDRCTPLVNAMHGGHLAMAKYLVSKNADINVRMMGDASLKDLANMGVEDDIRQYIAELFSEEK